METRKNRMSAKTFQQMLEDAAKHQRKHGHHNDEEHHLQKECIDWFKMSSYQRMPLFAVPNGGRRDATTGAKLKAEGVVAGVADLILLCPSFHRNYSSLCIEMKTDIGKQSQAQKEWQKKVELFGNKYVVCRSLEQFINEIRSYLNGEI